MATIPIEVIIQDAESPVTPTPVDPADQGENTNIIVPDTGAGTVDSNSSNSFTGSSAAIFIVSIVIAVLAVCAAVALLVRKHYKHKKADEAGMTRQEKRAMAATSTIAVLALTVLLGQLVVAGVVSPIATNAATDDTASDEAELDVDSKITIIATRTEDEDTTVATVKNTSTATSHQVFGYKVTASMEADATTANLYLDGDEISEYYIAPVVDDTLSNNTWGYTTEEESEDYLPIPLATNPTTIVKGYNNIDNESVDIYYTIQVDKDLPAGTYTGTLEYTLTDNNFPSTLTTMQGMTTEICEDTFTPGNQVTDPVPTATLTDIRDNKTYTIAKLADGNCWMTQNLDLQKEDLVAASLDNTNTDNPVDGLELPNSQISGSESWGGDEVAINTPHIYDLAKNGETYKYCLRTRYGDCLEYGDNIPTKELGNFYNWYIATAGTGTYDTGSTEGEPFEASGSICPAGWRLPNNSNSWQATDYSNLLYRYGILESPTSTSYIDENPIAIYEIPILLVPTGSYFDGINSVGISGDLWSSLAMNEAGARSLYFTPGEVYLWGNKAKRAGFAVRCLAK